MLAEQIPGTLFVLLMALAAYMNQDPDVIFILAIGCVAGWLSFNPTFGAYAWFGSIVIWALAGFLLFTRIFF